MIDQLNGDFEGMRDEKGLAVERELKAINVDAIYLHHDVSSEQSRKEVLEKTGSKFGGLDILFTKALEDAIKGRWHLSGKQAPHC